MILVPCAPERYIIVVVGATVKRRIQVTPSEPQRFSNRAAALTGPLAQPPRAQKRGGVATSA
jgi:uncharacterized protein (DUF1800 family)